MPKESQNLKKEGLKPLFNYLPNVMKKSRSIPFAETLPAASGMQKPYIALC